MGFAITVIISLIVVSSFIGAGIKNLTTRLPEESRPVVEQQFGYPFKKTPIPITPSTIEITPSPVINTIQNQIQPATEKKEAFPTTPTQNQTSQNPSQISGPQTTQTPNSAPTPTPTPIPTPIPTPTPAPTPTPQAPITPTPSAPSTISIGSSEITSRLIQLNKPFLTNKSITASSDSTSYVVESGSGKVLISAPHSANQIREGKIKDVDYCTGAIAKLLKEQTGAHLIYFPYQGTDPNYYDDVPYKQALGSYLALHPEINLVLDIHGADRSRAWDIDLGFMNGKSLFKFKDLPTVLGEIFKANGIGTISNNFFAAEDNQTVTKYVATRGKDAIQIEINRNYRCDEEGRSYKLVNSLYQIIEKYK